MPGGAAVTDEEVEYLAAALLTDDLADAKVVKTLNDQRVRYDIAVSVKPITLNVEKHVVVKSNGERTVVSASTDAYGPARYSVTWLTLATLAVLVGQFALPLNCIFRRIRSGIGAQRRIGESVSGLGGQFGLESFLAAHGLAAQGQDVRVVDNAVADGVGDCRITDGFMPTFRRQLCSQNRR